MSSPWAWRQLFLGPGYGDHKAGFFFSSVFFSSDTILSGCNEPWRLSRPSWLWPQRDFSSSPSIAGNLDLAAKAGAAALVAGVTFKILAADIPLALRTIGAQVIGELRFVTRPLFVTSIVCLIIGVILGHYLLTAVSVSPWAEVFGWPTVAVLVLYAGANGLMIVISFLGSLVPAASRPGLAEVQKQKVHGKAGYAAADQVDAALRDQDHGTGGAPHFRD